MKIAVWINYKFSPKIGGTFSYIDRLLKAIDNYEFNGDVEVCFATSYFVEVGGLQKELIRLRSPFELILSLIPGVSKIRLLQRIARRICPASYRKQLDENGVKIMFYPSQFGRHIDKFPFIVSHWDIAHRSTYAFPEFSLRLHKERNMYYRDFLPKALLVFAESEAGKDELLKYTMMNADRIHVVPIFPGECSTMDVTPQDQKDILDKMGLQKNKYFYYPSQFLAEKNHITVLKAFCKFSQSHPDYKLVFTGASSKLLFGTLDYIKSEADKLGLLDRVVFAGFIDIKKVSCLYRNASAHIMASFVGPTNMPPLEAMFVGCPVICSDLSGHKEEMGDAAIYFDAIDCNQLAESMEKLVKNRDLYLQRIEKRSKDCQFTVENALRSINEGFIKAARIRSTWA